jgi:hypothetical protein
MLESGRLRILQDEILRIHANGLFFHLDVTGCVNLEGFFA